ncbi:hypothetical protein BGZ46_007894 [Entomortierella lignicola]|nr:hypothetical protein BGZ46_007894 [Entomortierella lignicola]
MTTTESVILNIASNGPVATTYSTSSRKVPHQLQEIQMAELQAPHPTGNPVDFYSHHTSKDLFGDMEPLLRLNNAKASAALRSRL